MTTGKIGPTLHAPALLLALAVPCMAQHALSVSRVCSPACAGESTDCKMAIGHADFFGDTVEILETWDVFDPNGASVRVPALGNLDIEAVQGNTTCTAAGALPCLIGPPGSVLGGLPGDPNPGLVVFGSNQYVVQENAEWIEALGTIVSRDLCDDPNTTACSGMEVQSQAAASSGCAEPQGVEHAPPIVNMTCSPKCAGEQTDCTIAVGHADFAGDSTEIVDVWDTIDPAGQAVRIPSTGSLPIVGVFGNTTCSVGGSLPCLIGPGGSTLDGLPGDPNPGLVQFKSEEYLVQAQDANPLVHVGSLRTVDLCDDPDSSGCSSLTTLQQRAAATGIASCGPGLAACADTDSDGVRDDQCMWWASTIDGCSAIPIVFADMGGPHGACLPDGTADGHDRFHALDCFSNRNTLGQPGYQCEAAPPAAFNVDAGGAHGACSPDGVCDGNDVFHAINAFEGTATCGCPMGSGPAPVVVSKREILASAGLELVATPVRVRPRDLIEVDVYANDQLPDLRGYQLHVEASGGRSGRLELVDITVHDRKDAAFAGRAAWQAFNMSTQQMVAGLDSAGVKTRPSSYLATFVFRASDDASGRFAVTLLHEESNPEHRSFLFPTLPGDRLAIESTTAAAIVVKGRSFATGR